MTESAEPNLYTKTQTRQGSPFAVGHKHLLGWACNDMDEKWMPVMGYDGVYEVSSFGRVRSLDRIGSHPVYGDFLKKGKLIKAVPVSGYPSYNLCMNGRPRSFYAHRIVLEAFVGPCPSGMECCHNDGDKTNARLDNLRWDTPTNNHRDKLAHGTDGRGERASMAKLTNSQVLSIRSSTDKTCDLAKAYGVRSSTISLIRHRKNWSHLP